MAERLRPGDTLVIATHNPGKLAEIAALLGASGLHLQSAGALGLPEPEETAADFTGNARLKALAASTAASLPALADDSGFSVAALAGAPGVLSARWAGPAKNFAAAMHRVATEAGEPADRRAWFTCALCLAFPSGATHTFTGRVDGTWLFPPRGTSGFGYDPMFLPTGSTRTYGEMASAKKEQNSHRTRAFRQFRTACLV